MPFAVAWTDWIGQDGFVEGFVDFHLGRRRDWRVEDWGLELGVFGGGGGEPMGIQALNGADFVRARSVITGSWLGSRFQGRGYGTEMRAAVLELGVRRPRRRGRALGAHRGECRLDAGLRQARLRACR